MMTKPFRLKILTPNKTVLDKDVTAVVLRTSEGDMGILHGHEPYSALLTDGILRAYEGREQTDEIAVMGGCVMIQDNEVVVLSSLADKPEEIANDLARIERERAENVRKEQIADQEMHRAEKALRHALFHGKEAAE